MHFFLIMYYSTTKSFFSFPCAFTYCTVFYFRLLSLFFFLSFFVQAVGVLDVARESPICPLEIKESLDKCIVSLSFLFSLS